MVSPTAVRTLIDEHPELEAAIERILEADEPFAFDDIDVDTGRFGEIVDADIVEQTDAGYVVTDRRAVERGLAGDVPEAGAERRRARSVQLPEPTLIGCLGAATLLVILLRIVPILNVFQEGAVVLSANDPYYYRYWVEQLLTTPPESLAALPEAIADEEPLFVATLWLVADLFGGTDAAAGWVLAWYPVVAALLTAALLYGFSVEVTTDRRIGIAAVAMLAVIPGHAARTSVGFADHHPFDAIWLLLAALSLAVLVRAERWTRRRQVAVLGLGVGVAGQTLAWRAGPLLLIPIGLVVLGRAVLAADRRDSPARTLAGTLAGLAIGTLLVLLAHGSLGWHSRTVAITPALLLLASLVVVGVTEAGRRYGLDAKYVLAVLLAAGGLGLATAAIALPAVWTDAVGSLTGELFRAGDITETRGLFVASIGWLLWFGLILAVALPYLAWGTAKLFEDAGWTVPVAYGWYLLLLASIQVRFIGELAAFTALFAGVGFVHIVERVGTARRPAPFEGAAPVAHLPTPSRAQLQTVLLLFVLITGLSALQAGAIAYDASIPPEQYRTADWIADDAADRNLEYPDDYVFSAWDRNRMYNYFVNGDARSYSFARERYTPFVNDGDPERFYERHHDRIGYVVYAGESARNGDVGRALDAYGSRTDETPGLQHYRAVHLSDTARYTVFRLVAGATLTGTAEPERRVTVESEQRIAGRTVTYQRQVRTDSSGQYRVTVPYPGTYVVDGTTVEVPEAAVTSGTRVPVNG